MWNIFWHGRINCINENFSAKSIKTAKATWTTTIATRIVSRTTIGIACSATQWYKCVIWSDFTEKQSSKFVIHGQRFCEFDYRVQVSYVFQRIWNTIGKKYEGWTDEKKVSLHLQTLGTDENYKYTNFGLPRRTGDISWEETVNILSSIFGEWVSLFQTRFSCLNMVKRENEDFVTYAGNVNRMCERFMLLDLSLIDLNVWYSFKVWLLAKIRT